ncbi:unnamed protein product [Rotaria socialis]|uniref:Uncharacterized protein n=1 Tax=Rotaria socialis TaxID=392032 RepID=A0A817VKM8_9BILA|nr:unnamed protein product [Rotaria socialis]CAF3357373.1 unnamed protein product [Rotaria socialis]CAF3381044.1 unnamed protein product [Rotaria socialis]CAF4124026.1 unnamed protein product [Rotaria socialis]CAF4359769.1 unnamed protein product [Rotaria socialis]
MVKDKYYRNAERYMIEYKMRTPYPIPTEINQSNYIKQHTRSTRPHPAHERSHAKHNSGEGFYSSEGHIDKSQRTKKPVQQQNQSQTNNQGTAPTSLATANRSSCCTIL